MLNDEQYNFLMEQSQNFASLASTGSYHGLPHDWLAKFAELHKQLFPNESIRFSCGACVRGAMQRMANLITQYQTNTTIE